jgi:hypothetical protein
LKTTAGRSGRGTWTWPSACWSGIARIFFSLPERCFRIPFHGLLNHVWETENGILKRMGSLVDPADMPGDAMGRLQVIRAEFQESLPKWAEEDILVEDLGEKWSPRKALRRALWHERYHIEQLEELIKTIP